MTRFVVVVVAAAGVAAGAVWLGVRVAASDEAHPAMASSANDPATSTTTATPSTTRSAQLPALAAAATTDRLTASLAADLADRDPVVRASAVAELAASPDPDAATLTAASRDPDMRVSGAAVNGLNKLYAREQLEQERGDDIERRSAAILLARQDLEVAVPALIDALADRDEGVRANAHEALVSRSRGRDFAMDAGAWRAWWSSRARP